MADNNATNNASQAARNVSKTYKTIDFQTEAKAKARAILEKAEQRAKVIEQTAYREGFEKGDQAGQKMGFGRIMPVLEEFVQLNKAVQKAKEEYLRLLEPEIVKLSVAIAEKVTRVVVDENSDVVKNAVREAIQAAVDKGDIRLRLNPADLETIESIGDELSTVEGVSSLAFESDPEIPKGGVRLIASEGFVEISPDLSVEKIKENLT